MIDKTTPLMKLKSPFTFANSFIFVISPFGLLDGKVEIKSKRTIKYMMKVIGIENTQIFHQLNN